MKRALALAVLCIGVISFGSDARGQVAEPPQQVIVTAFEVTKLSFTSPTTSSWKLTAEGDSSLGKLDSFEGFTPEFTYSNGSATPTILIGLLIPAVAKVRQAAAARTQAMNNVKQILLATSNYAATSKAGHYPSAAGWTAGDGQTPFVTILPHLDNGSAFAEWSKTNTNSSVTTNPAVKTYVDPLDPAPYPRAGSDGSYATNAMVFRPFGEPLGPASMTDGLSSTILYSQHYMATCDNNRMTFIWFASPTVLMTRRDNSHSRGATFANGHHTDIFPVPGDQPNTSKSSVHGMTFQVRPTDAECNSRMA